MGRASGDVQLQPFDGHHESCTASVWYTTSWCPQLGTCGFALVRNQAVLESLGLGDLTEALAGGGSGQWTAPLEMGREEARDKAAKRAEQLAVKVPFKTAQGGLGGRRLKFLLRLMRHRCVDAKLDGQS